jgi:hypothetical protein
MALSSIIALTPFRIFREDDNDVRIPTEKEYRDVDRSCDYHRYALALPDRRHSELLSRESCLESVMGYAVHLGRSAEQLASSFEELPPLASGKGLALNFDNIPFCSFEYMGTGMDSPQVYFARRFDEEEIKAFLQGLSGRNDELREFSRVQYGHFTDRE